MLSESEIRKVYGKTKDCCNVPSAKNIILSISNIKLAIVNLKQAKRNKQVRHCFLIMLLLLAMTSGSDMDFQEEVASVAM